MTLACEGSATQALDPTSCGSFDYARRLASLRMTLACEGSATQALDAASCGSFDFARRLASLRMTFGLGGPESVGIHAWNSRLEFTPEVRGRGRRGTRQGSDRGGGDTRRT